MPYSNDLNYEKQRTSYIETILQTYLGKIVNIKHLREEKWKRAIYVGKESHANNELNVFVWKSTDEKKLEQILGYKTLMDKEFTIDEQEEGLYVTFLTHYQWAGVKNDSTFEDDIKIFERYNSFLT
ncbi:hypothetical protein HN385_03695 [archaeon]|jgi:hypothetical protein|nr:hypothetical protein [archaeon]MBT3451713.1 hypothetical protein [archaeon]MBT6869801.1 hypothetical protein [archaeon]MBT7192756.1 hypothetical protein [archaeon]MBT7380781.1 hypothetical protein [archaeon]